MKSKISLRIISVLIGLVSVFTVFGAANAYSVYADEETTTNAYEAVAEVTERAAVEVPLDYVLVKAGTKTSVIKSDDIEKVEVKTEDKSKTYEAEKKYTAEDTGYLVGGGYKYNDGKIFYYAAETDDAVYYVYTTVKGVETAYETRVTVSNKPGIVKYDETKLTKEKLTEVQTAINALKADDGSLELPFDVISELITSTVLDKSVVAYTVHYEGPGSTSFSTTSSKKGELTKLTVKSDGVYKFFVTANDGEGNEITVKDLEYKDGEFLGYYDKETGELKVPVFTYSYTSDDFITVEAKIGSEKGRVNQRYQSATFTIENADDVHFVLQYSADGENWGVAENGKQAKFDESLFTASQLYFTPLVKGYFRFTASAKGGKSGTEVRKDVASDAISVQDEVEELKLVDERFKNFFKNNWLSMIFLGIAVLCLIGIIVIALWKPSDGKKVKKAEESEQGDEKAVEAEEVKEETKATESETAEEVSENAETTENAEGTTEAAEGETAENAEVTEQTTETAEQTDGTTAETAEVKENDGEKTE